MTADWDVLVDAAPPEVREALNRLRHHVVLTTQSVGGIASAAVAAADRERAHGATRDAMGAVLAWAARHHGLLCPECAAITCHDPRRVEAEEATTDA